MEWGNCKLCLNDGYLAGSHIIPEALHKLSNLYGAKRNCHSYNGTQRQIIQKGYREPLLCPKCEAWLNDSYEEEFHNNIAPNMISSNSKIISANYKTTKLYLLSILWRASISKMYGKSVKLNIYGNEIRELIRNVECPKEEYYPILISKTDDDTHLLTSFVYGKKWQKHWYHFHAINHSFFIGIGNKSVKYNKLVSVREDNTLYIETIPFFDDIGVQYALNVFNSRGEL